MTGSLLLHHYNTVSRLARDGADDLGLYTKDYGLAVGFDNPADEKEGRLKYLIVNRVTGVVEGAGPFLPQALANLFQIQVHLDAVRIAHLNKPEGVTLQ